MTNRNLGVLLGITVLLVGLLVGLTAFNYEYTSEKLGGNDFAPAYLGTRLFLTEGLSPYSETTRNAIQQMMLGRSAIDGEVQHQFSAPFYSMLFVAPFAMVEDYGFARALWMSTLMVAVIVVAGVSARLVEWRPSPFMAYLFFVFMLTWVFTVRPIIDGNSSVLLTLFIILMLLCVFYGYDRWAGVLLAFHLIKPQAVILIVILILIWAASQKRKMILSNFFLTIGFLLGLSLLIEPSWPIQNLQQFFGGQLMVTQTTPIGLFTEWWGKGSGIWLGRSINLMAIGLFIWANLSVLKGGYHSLFWAAMFSLALQPFIGFHTEYSNYILYLPGIILLSGTWVRRWKQRGVWIALIHYIVVGVGLWWGFNQMLLLRTQQSQFPLLLFGFPLYMLIMLIWSRWWAVRPPIMPIDTVRNALNRL